MYIVVHVQFQKSPWSSTGDKDTFLVNCTPDILCEPPYKCLDSGLDRLYEISSQSSSHRVSQEKKFHNTTSNEYRQDYKSMSVSTKQGHSSADSNKYPLNCQNLSLESLVSRSAHSAILFNISLSTPA